MTAKAVRVPRPPETEKERHTLQRVCLQRARESGFSGKYAKLEADRLYLDAVTEARRTVREAGIPNQPSLLVVPQIQGERRSEGGIILPR